MYNGSGTGAYAPKKKECIDMDVKAKIEEIVEKLKGDGKLAEKFKSDPVKTVEGLLGVDLPDDVMEKVVAGVKGKMSLDSVSGAVDALKKLF